MMKTLWHTGMVLTGALALAACGSSGDNAAQGNVAAPAANEAAPADAADAEGNEAAPAEERASEGQAAGGSQQDFTIVNNTGQAVMTLNVSASNQDEWGPDILGQNILPNGQQGQIQFARGQDQCEWDIRATFEGGGTGDWRGINLCETTTITLTAQ